MLRAADSPVQSGGVQFCASMYSSAPIYSEVQWNPVESSGVHVDYVGDGKVLTFSMEWGMDSIIY